MSDERRATQRDHCLPILLHCLLFSFSSCLPFLRASRRSNDRPTRKKRLSSHLQYPPVRGTHCTSRRAPTATTVIYPCMIRGERNNVAFRTRGEEGEHTVRNSSVRCITRTHSGYQDGETSKGTKAEQSVYEDAREMIPHTVGTNHSKRGAIENDCSDFA